MIPLWLTIVFIFFTIGPGMWFIIYFASSMYTSDQLLDMLDRGEITELEYSFLYEKMSLGEYKLYPKFISILYTGDRTQ